MTGLNHHVLAILVVSGLSSPGVGCDLADSTEETPAAGTHRPVLTVGQESSTSDGEPGPTRPDTDAACRARCEGEDSLSRTDRATCKLNCGPVVAATPSGATGAVERVVACAGACDAKRLSETDRATCLLQCASAEHAVLGACAQSCINTMIGAWSSCQTNDPDADIATCELLSQGTARRCVSVCPQPG